MAFSIKTGSATQNTENKEKYKPHYVPSLNDIISCTSSNVASHLLLSKTLVQQSGYICAKSPH